MTLQSDLNLLPQKDAKSSLKRFALPLACIFGALVVLLAAGIIIPKIILNGKQNKIAELQSQRESYAAVSQEYDALMGELQTTQQWLTIIDGFSSGSHSSLEMYRLIKEQCPPDVTLLSITFDKIGVVIDGRAASDGSVANFSNNLIATGKFAYVDLQSVEPDEDLRSFIMTLTYPAF